MSLNNDKNKFIGFLFSYEGSHYKVKESDDSDFFTLVRASFSFNQQGIVKVNYTNIPIAIEDFELFYSIKDKNELIKLKYSEYFPETLIGLKFKIKNLNDRYYIICDNFTISSKFINDITFKNIGKYKSKDIIKNIESGDWILLDSSNINTVSNLKNLKQKINETIQKL